MDSDYLIQVLVMLGLVCLSALFSATETAFSCLNKTRMKLMAEEGNKAAQKTLKLAEEYDKLLSTILVGNNVVNIALASIGTVLFVRLLGNSGASVSTAVITVVVLIFGEVTPKSLAKEAPERFAMKMSGVMAVLTKLLTPVNWLFSQWKKLLSRVFSVQDNRRLTQDELLTLVEEAEHEGGMDAEESVLVKSAIEFHDRDVADILTPRVRVEGISVDATAAEVAEQFEESGYSRLPVFDGTLDNIVGVVHQKDFYRTMRAGRTDLREIMKQPVIVPESVQISTLMQLLQKTKSQMAVVADEYGGTLGIVTMEDILEELVGEIWDEHDEIEIEFQETQKDVWRVLGSAPVEEMTERFHIGEDTEATTVGGFVMELAERIPAQGETFTCGEYQILVCRADGRRVEEIEIRRTAQKKDKPEN